MKYTQKVSNLILCIVIFFAVWLILEWIYNSNFYIPLIPVKWNRMVKTILVFASLPISLSAFKSICIPWLGSKITILILTILHLITTSGLYFFEPMPVGYKIFAVVFFAYSFAIIADFMKERPQ